MIIKCVKIGLNGQGPFLIEALEKFNGSDWLADANHGDKYSIEVVEMTADQLVALPEFQGF